MSSTDCNRRPLVDDKSTKETYFGSVGVVVGVWVSFEKADLDRSRLVYKKLLTCAFETRACEG